MKSVFLTMALVFAGTSFFLNSMILITHSGYSHLQPLAKVLFIKGQIMRSLPIANRY